MLWNEEKPPLYSKITPLQKSYFTSVEEVILGGQGNITCHRKCTTFSLGPLSTEIKSGIDHGLDFQQQHLQNDALE